MTTLVAAAGLQDALREVEAHVASGDLPALERSAASWDLPHPISSEVLRIAAKLIPGEHPEPRQGFFLVLSGLDKAGKGTQIFNTTKEPGVTPLVSHLKSRGFQTLGLTQPSYDTMMGQLVSAALGRREEAIRLEGHLDPSFAWMLWSLDRAQHNPRVRSWLGTGSEHIVISNRWTESNVVYQSIRGVAPERVLKFEANVEKQDVTIILDVPVDRVLDRLNPRYADRFERRPTLEAALEKYTNLPSIYPYGEILHLQADSPPQDVNARLIRLVDGIMDAWAQTPEKPGKR